MSLPLQNFGLVASPVKSASIPRWSEFFIMAEEAREQQRSGRFEA
jgi:hypothetical protein